MTPIETIVRFTASSPMVALNHAGAHCQRISVRVARARLHDPTLKNGDLRLVSYDPDVASAVGRRLQQLQEQALLTVLEDKRPLLV